MHSNEEEEPLFHSTLTETDQRRNVTLDATWKRKEKQFLKGKTERQECTQKQERKKKQKSVHKEEDEKEDQEEHIQQDYQTNKIRNNNKKRRKTR